MATEKGNPNVFTTFKGKHECSLALGGIAYVMESCINTVQFLGDYESDATGLIMTLPEDVRPFETIRVPCVNEAELGYINIASDGKITGDRLNTIHYLNGLSFHISANYY